MPRVTAAKMPGSKKGRAAKEGKQSNSATKAKGTKAKAAAKASSGDKGTTTTTPARKNDATATENGATTTTPSSAGGKEGGKAEEAPRRSGRLVHAKAVDYAAIEEGVAIDEEEDATTDEGEATPPPRNVGSPRSFWVDVPPGKLGASVVGCERGVAIQAIQPSSPLWGKARVGDRIVAIDGRAVSGIRDLQIGTDRKRRVGLVAWPIDDDSVSATHRGKIKLETSHTAPGSAYLEVVRQKHPYKIAKSQLDALPSGRYPSGVRGYNTHPRTVEMAAFVREHISKDSSQDEIRTDFVRSGRKFVEWNLSASKWEEVDAEWKIAVHIKTRIDRALGRVKGKKGVRHDDSNRQPGTKRQKTTPDATTSNTNISKTDEGTNDGAEQTVQNKSDAPVIEELQVALQRKDDELGAANKTIADLEARQKVHENNSGAGNGVDHTRESCSHEVTKENKEREVEENASAPCTSSSPATDEGARDGEVGDAENPLKAAEDEEGGKEAALVDEAALRAKLEDKDAAIADLEREKSKMHTWMSSVERDLRKAMAKKDAAMAEAAVLRVELEEREAVLGKANERIASLEEDLQGARELIEIMRPRHISVPPGKLGATVNFVEGHAVVEEIETSSPLWGKVRAGDRIVTVNGVAVSKIDDLRNGNDRDREIGIVRCINQNQAPSPQRHQQTSAMLNGIIKQNGDSEQAIATTNLLDLPRGETKYSKLTALSHAQTSMLPYPVGCLVWYQSNGQMASGSVRSISMDVVQRKLHYEIKNTHGCGDGTNVISEDDLLSFGAGCPVRVQTKSAGRHLEGQVLYGRAVNGTVTYTVLAFLEGKEKQLFEMEENVVEERLKYQKTQNGECGKTS